MFLGSGTAVVRAVLVVPVILLVLFAGVFGLFALLCGPERRKCAMSLSKQALTEAGVLVHGPAPRRPQLPSGRARSS